MNSEELIIRNEELGIRNKYRLISPLISVMNVVNVAKGVWGLVDNKLKQISEMNSRLYIALQIRSKCSDEICLGVRSEQ